MVTMHSPEFLEVEAETLETARQQVQSHLLPNFFIISETIVSDGKPVSIQGIADTLETAKEKALSLLPPNAEILSQHEFHPASRMVIPIIASNEEEARTNAESQGRQEFHGDVVVENIKLVDPGSKGFLGRKARPPQYEATVVKDAVYKVTYRMKPKIKVEIGDARTEFQLSFKRELAKYDSLILRPNVHLEVSENSAKLGEFLVTLEIDRSIDQKEKFERTIFDKNYKDVMEEIEMLVGKKFHWQFYRSEDADTVDGSTTYLHYADL